MNSPLDAAPPGAGPDDRAIVIVGAGFAGLAMAIELKRHGLHDFVILEKAGDLGGTWLENDYPGCACDIQSHLYSFSFEPNPDWSRMFPPQPEIREYLKRCADKYGLRPHLRFGAEVTEARFDETAAAWRVRTADGRAFTARALIGCLGGLSTPALPDIRGLERFRGRMFHSQQWDHGCELEGQRVAVIGTGASAIQFVPEIAPKAAHLDLYQRTPPWVIPRPDRPMLALEKRVFRRWPFVQRLYRRAIYWLRETQAFGFVRGPWFLKIAQFVIAQRHLKKQVPDAALRAKLTPSYRLGCKRVLLSSDYYPALTRPNVAVITDGIREIREHGVVTADGTERPADVLVLGTGFRATEPIAPGVIFGRGGRDLADAWKDGPEAYRGVSVAGFPNLFLVPGPNTGLGHGSVIFMIESLTPYVRQALQHLLGDGVQTLEVRAQAQADYNRELHARMQRTVWQTGGCRSWYQHESGKNTVLWPGYTWQYRLQMRRFDAGAYETAAAPVETLRFQSSGS